MWWKRIKTAEDVFKQPFQAFVRTVGARLLGVVQRLRPPAPVPESVQSLLIVRRNRLGDAVLTAQVLRVLQEKRPEIKITVITNSYSAPVYSHALPTAEVVVLPDKHMGSPLGLFFHPKVRQLRDRIFDVSLIASGSFSSRSILILLLFQSRFRVGVRDDKRPSLPEAALDAKIAMSELEGEMHQSVKIAKLFALAGLQTIPNPTPSTRQAAETHSVLIFPECNRPESRLSWPMWVSFALELNSLGKVVTLCTSTPSQPLPKEIQSISCSNTEMLIREIQRHDEIVCSEGGASHLGAMLNRRLTVFSGVKIAKTWFPFSFQCALLERPNLPQTISVQEMLALYQRTHPDAISWQN